MPQAGEVVTVKLLMGKDVPAWDGPNCERRWAGEVLPNGAEVVLVEPFPRLDDPEFGAEWWIVHAPALNVWAPVEIHDHLGME